jgi:hypothetical protein
MSNKNANNSSLKENSKTEQNNISPVDQFDPASLRLSQDFSANVGVKKALVTVPVRKPNKQDFVRVHPDTNFHLETAVIELKDDQETYLIVPSLWHELPGEIQPKALFTAINRQGVLFLWPITLPGEDGRHNEWSRSAFEGAQMAKSKWIRLTSNRSLGAYEIYEATGSIPDPEWPEYGFKEILKIAFRDRYIDTIEHPVLRRLRGEV